MFVIHARNVEIALWEGIKILQEYGEKVSPRGEETIEAPAPVVTEYSRPLERVLLNQVRDANPFFHFMESMWILAGRRDVKFLSQFNSRIVDYSDDGKVFHAPYGYRLRHGAFGDGQDQLLRVVDVLRKDPDSRQAVCQIWDHEADLNVESKDIPCNDMVFFKLRNGKLNMTVCNRSNDMIWGAYGANAVQFSFIQEYVASNLGVEVGYYRQMSDSFHVYTRNPQWKALSDWSDSVSHTDYLITYPDLDIQPYPMIRSAAEFDVDLDSWFQEPRSFRSSSNPFFGDVASPIYRCYLRHKQFKDGRNWVSDIKASDWRLACYNWLKKREKG